MKIDKTSLLMNARETFFKGSFLDELGQACHVNETVGNRSLLPCEIIRIIWQKHSLDAQNQCFHKMFQNDTNDYGYMWNSVCDRHE